MITCVKIKDFKPSQEGKYLAKYINRFRISNSELGNNWSEFGNKPKINDELRVKFNKKGEFRGFPPHIRIIWISTKPVL